MVRQKKAEKPVPESKPPMLERKVRVNTTVLYFLGGLLFILITVVSLMLSSPDKVQDYMTIKQGEKPIAKISETVATNDTAQIDGGVAIEVSSTGLFDLEILPGTGIKAYMLFVMAPWFWYFVQSRYRRNIIIPMIMSLAIYLMMNGNLFGLK